MKSFWALLIASLIGVVIAVGVVIYDQLPFNSHTQPIPEFNPPYKKFIAATGVVEPSSKNIQVGSKVSGVISRVFIKSGDRVKKGEPLFNIDDTELKNQIAVAKQEVNLEKTRVLNAKKELKLLISFRKIFPNMVKKSDFLAAKNRVIEEEAKLNLAKANLSSLQKRLLFYTVSSPIDGVVLSSKLAKGEYFPKNSSLLTIGSSSLNLRVSINEYDVWKFKPNTKAVAYVRGHPNLKVDLKYLYTIPFVVPKKNLTGSPTERVDTKVLQVLYAIPKIDFPLYAGEQLDVFIEAE